MFVFSLLFKLSGNKKYTGTMLIGASKIKFAISRDSSISIIKQNTENEPNASLKLIGSLEIPDSHTVGEEKLKISKISNNAFFKSLLTDVTLPKHIKTIGENAFSESSLLFRINISETEITEIPENCFSLCSALTEIVLPKTLTKICAHAFAGCHSLVSVKLKSPHTLIQKSSFENCVSLVSFPFEKIDGNIEQRAFANTGFTELRIESNIKQVLNEAFQCCFELQNVHFSSKSCTLSKGVFAYCTKLSSIEIEGYSMITICESAFAHSGITVFSFGHVKEIGKKAFESCFSLTSVNLSSTKIKEIPNGLFMNCTNLKTFVSPQTMTRIGVDAFRNTKIEEIEFPKTLKEIQCNAFRNCTSLKHVDFRQTTSVIIGDFAFASSAVNSVKFSKGRLEIGDHAFDKSGIQRFVISGSYVTIGAYCFANCDNLVYADLKSSNTENIPSCVFFNCSHLKDVYLSSSTTEIGESAFIQCGITSFTSFSKLATIKSKAFVDCFSLSHVDLRNSEITHISNSLFERCSNLTSIELPQCLQVIGKRAFVGTAITELTVYRKLKTISDYAFWKCSSLKAINLASTSLVSIGDYAFMGTSIRTLKLPYSLQTIGIKAFAKAQITKIFFNEELQEINVKAFSECKHLRGVNLSNTKIKIIKSKTFKDCKNLTIVELPSNIFEIEKEAFARSSLAEVKFPDSLIGIGQLCFFETNIKKLDFNNTKLTKLPFGAFMSMKSLYSIVLPPQLTEIGSYTFCFCAIQSLSFPKTLEHVNESAIIWCPFLTCIDFSHTEIRTMNTKVISHCHLLSDIVMPTTLFIVKDSFINDCPKITKVYYNGTVGFTQPIVFSNSVFAFLSRAYPTDHFMGASIISYKTKPKLVEHKEMRVNISNCDFFKSLRKKLEDTKDFTHIKCTNGTAQNIRSLMQEIEEAKENETIVYQTRSETVKSLKDSSLESFLAYDLRNTLITFTCIIYGILFYKTATRPTKPEPKKGKAKHIIRQGVVW